MAQTRLEYLLHCYFNDSCSDTERYELMILLNEPRNKEKVLSVMDSCWNDFNSANSANSTSSANSTGTANSAGSTGTGLTGTGSTGSVFTAEQSGKMIDSILKSNNLEDNQSRLIDRRIINKRIINKRVAYAAAAIIILFVASTAILKLVDKKSIDQVATAIEVQDIQPGGDKATLTLADGKVILLDSAANGILTKQGNAQVVKLNNGQLVYNTSGESAKSLYNKVSTPRGGQYSLVLADGTRVWLNAESSLRFPAAFTGNERRVELIGEAYFEVEKNASMPFKVMIQGKGEIEVLGTRFNVNSYSDESSVKTTLLEGKVKITPVEGNVVNKKFATYLSPDHQATISSNGEVSVEAVTNADNIIAWKNGKFNFGEGADITDIMRQVSRWYDVDVEYQGAVNARIGGVISRDVSVSKVLDMLEMTGALKFEIQGRKVIVKPVK